MGIGEMILEGLVEDVMVEGPSDEDWNWYLEQVWVDPAELAESYPS